MSKAKALPGADLCSLSRQLALVVDSDLSMQEGIELIGEQTKSKPLKNLLARVNDRLMEGESLGKALEQEKELLPDYYIKMIGIGELSGNLETILTRMADSYEKDAKIQSKVISAVTYPIILTVLMLGVIVLLLAEVLPMFEEVLASLGGQMPGLTLALMGIGSFISRYFLVLLGIVALLALAVVVLRQSARGREWLDALKLNTPVRRGIIRDMASVRFSRNLAMLLRSGIGLSESVRMTASVIANMKIRALIENAAAKIESGDTLKSALVSLGLFPGLLLRILAVAESTGHTDSMLDRAADATEEELEQKLGRLTTVLEPALIIVLSLIVGIVLISVILPVVRIMNTVG